MKILLLGDYSNVHATLARGLRELGHNVTVASDGDGWKNYPRDIDLARKSLGKFSSLGYLRKVEASMRCFRGFDVVQLINPIFLPLRAERFWRYYAMLRRNNKKVFLGAFGMDYFYAVVAADCQTFRYSDYNLGRTFRRYPEGEMHYHDWVLGEKGRLCRHIAGDCDGIVSGLYEYYAAYRPYFPEKTAYIPFPVVVSSSSALSVLPTRIRFFIGVQRNRSEYKGTDVMLRALMRLAAEMPDRVEMVKVESVPFADYCDLLSSSHVILDQLYSYTPAMNALEAMARGLVVVGGGEPENYEILGEKHLRPLVNVLPDEESVYNALRDLALHPDSLPRLSEESVEYVRLHHDYRKVAQQYVDFWTKRM